MPFISTKTNIEITKEKEASIKQKLGKAIEIIPGKSEGWLMLSFEDQLSMYFKGQGDKPMAFVEVKLFGSAGGAAYDKLTAAITKIINEELSINPAQIYVKYEEVKYWGWNGANF
jgi:phenylpyruvate tautomerase PptA (4-oxalocrotonate tautomerase family)